MGRLKMQYIQRNSEVVLWASAIVVLGCVGLAQRAAQAQNSVAGWADRKNNFKVAPLDPVPPNYATVLDRVLKTGTFTDADEEQKFADFFSKQFFPLVTRLDNRQSKDDVGVKLRLYLNRCEKPEEKKVYDKLVDLTLEFMTKVAKDGQYHPAVRVNAMLVIGEVNSPKAVAVLLATLRDKDQIDAVFVAALADLVRLAELVHVPRQQSCLSDPAVARPVIERMAQIAGKPIPANDSPQFARADAIRWMRGQAADVLAALESTGPNNEVPPALLTMLDDKDLPIPIRSKAARALAKLKYGESPYLAALAKLTRDALNSDQPADRGRVRLVAHDVLEGLKPFASSTNSNDQESYDGLKKALDALLKDTESALTPDKLKEAVAKAKDAVEILLKR
jgi:HEAT repeat protein